MNVTTSQRLRPAATVSEKMIKVDHAGENGAVNIYRAQRLGARLTARDLLPELVDFQAHEMEHRAIFAGWLSRNGVRRCVSYHLCGAGGYALGLVTGFMGRRAIHATTYAVEHVVLAHLGEQMDYLRKVDPSAHACVSAIHADESEHHDHAEAGMGRGDWLSRTLVVIVKFCTEGVIRFGMR